jgi:protease-4
MPDTSPPSSGQFPPSSSPQVVVQQAAPPALGKYGRLLVAALAVAIMIIVGQYASYQSYFSPPGGPQEKYHSLSETATKKIAVIRVEGSLIDPDGFVKKQIDAVRKDDDVVGVVLRVDSPGGTVTASDYLYHHLRQLAKERKIPLVVSMGSICASGGYYLSMAVGDQPKAIFAEPTTWTGSIGVVIPHYDFSGLLAQHNVKDDSIASHKYKLMGSPTRDLSDEERAEERKLLQELVDVSFERFKEVVRSGRPKLRADPAALDKIATGQIFTARQALDGGLVDEIGFIEDAVARAAELAGMQEDDVRCVKYDEPPTSISALLGAKTGVLPSARSELAALLDLTAPRAYFLCTWLPGLLTNRH